MTFISILLLAEGSVNPVPADYLRFKILPQIKIAPLPHLVAGSKQASIAATIDSEAFLVVDASSAAILAADMSNKALYPASTIKMVTALVAMEHYDLSQKVVLTATDLRERSNSGFQIGDSVSVRDLLTALLIQSDNAAAEILANHAPGGRENFLEWMSFWSLEHNLQNSHYFDPAGFDNSKQLLSSSDLLLIARELIAKPELAKIVSLADADIQVERAGNTAKLHLASTNFLLKENIGVTGIKTGTTPLAGEVLVTIATRQGHPLYIVLMKSNNRFEETKKILEWVDQSYSWQSVD